MCSFLKFVSSVLTCKRTNTIKLCDIEYLTFLEELTESGSAACCEFSQNQKCKVTAGHHLLFKRNTKYEI